MKQRQLLNMFLLTLCTLGFYMIYLIAKQYCELATVLGEEKNIALQIILIVVTVGFWGAYLMVKSAEYVNKISSKYSMVTEDLTSLVLCLFIVGAAPVSSFLIQDKINVFVSTRG